MAVEFDEDKGYNANQYGGQQSSKMAAWLISKNLARDEKGANAILVFVALIFFGLAIYLAFFR